MFSQAYVKNSVHGGGGVMSASLLAGIHSPFWAEPPSRQTPPLDTTGYGVNKRVVHILLECILVWQDFRRKQHEIGPRDRGGQSLDLLMLGDVELRLRAERSRFVLTNAKWINMKNLVMFARLHFLCNSLQH